MSEKNSRHEGEGHRNKIAAFALAKRLKAGAWRSGLAPAWIGLTVTGTVHQLGGGHLVFACLVDVDLILFECAPACH